MARYSRRAIVVLAMVGLAGSCLGMPVSLIENPGFDDWESPSDATVWEEITHPWISYQRGDITRIDPPCMEVTINGNTANGVWQIINVGTGAAVSASAWVRPQTLPGQSFVVRVGIEPWGMDDIWSSDMVWSDEAPLNSWTDLSVEAISQGPTVAVFVGALAGSGGVSYKVDDVVVTPEPATLALLGLGAVAVLRRRTRK